MLTETRKEFLEMLAINGLTKEEALEVSSMARSDEKVRYTMKNIEELLRSGQELTREDALLATIPKKVKKPDVTKE